MAKKQKSFADKAAGSGDKDAVYVKYINSVRSEKTGHWRFNEQMIKTRKGESLDVAIKRLDEAANLIDIDLTEFSKVSSDKKEELSESKSGEEKKSEDLNVENAEANNKKVEDSKETNSEKKETVKE